MVISVLAAYPLGYLGIFEILEASLRMSLGWFVSS